jgi:3-oxoacyl-[acyl-carrier-protein] synthase-3
MGIKTGIIGTGACLPEKIVTNDDLAKMVDTSDEWITARTGIKERRLTDYATSTSDLAVKAARAALTNAKVSPDEVDLILVGTSTPDMLFPSVGCILQDRLGAKNAAAFDVSAACSGFNYALACAAALVEAAQYNCVLVVGADTLTKYVDFKDRNICVLFGDGAGAVVLKQFSDGSGILSNFLGAEGAGGTYLTMPGGGSRDPELRLGSRCISMDGKEVFKFAVKALEVAVEKVLEKGRITVDELALLVPHQANHRIIEHVIKRMRLPKEKVYVNLHKYGNTSAASVPIALHEAVSEGKIKKGDLVVLAGFGAGLTYGANLIRWSI